MNYKLDYKDFDLYHTLISGQTFEWFLDKDSNTWNGNIYKNPISIKQIGDSKVGYLEITSEKDLTQEIIHYFGLDQDYKSLIDQISFDKNIKITLEKLYGLRVIRQDPWFCINSFILSSNNTVKNIQNILRNISNSVIPNTNTFYMFPEYEYLQNITEEDLRKCKAGFRAKYLIDFYNKIKIEKDFIDKVKDLSYNDAKLKLMTVKGIGEKVADCILLYAYGKYEAYPVDTHLRKATYEGYFSHLPKVPSDKVLREWASDYWKDLAGFAHFFLFTYRRLYGKIT